MFEGRRQLLLYHFMHAPTAAGWPEAGCPGCFDVCRYIGQFVTPHLHARGISLAMVSLAPLARIEAYRKRMGWSHPWVSSANNTFNHDLGLTTPDEERHGLSVLVRQDGEIFRTYFTSRRGSEILGNVWGFLDATPYGRQETWEDSPPGWPQSPPYSWWRRHDEYSSDLLAPTYPLIPAKAGTRAGGRLSTELTENTDASVPSVFSVVDLAGASSRPGFRRDERGDMGLPGRAAPCPRPSSTPDD